MPDAPSTININNRRFSLESYMKFRKEKGLRNEWRFIGYSRTGRVKYYASKKFDFFLGMWRDDDGYYISPGKNNKSVGATMGMMVTQNEALKMLKIAQDFMTTFGWTWEHVKENFDKENFLVEGHTRNQINADLKIDAPTPDERLNDHEIRDLYNEVYAQVNQRYPLRKPPLIIMHRLTNTYGFYRITTGKIYIESYLSEQKMRDVMVHELVHAYIRQHRLEDSKSHGYYFLQMYKVLTGRDYFDDQDKLIREMKESMRPKPVGDLPDYHGKITMVYTQK